MHSERNRYGMTLVAEGNYEAAIVQFRMAIDASDQIEYQVNLGLGYLLCQTPENARRAVETFHAVLSRQPIFPLVWGYLGASYCLLNETDKALDYLLRGLAEPSLFIVRHLYLIYYRLGRFYETKFYTEVALAMAPDDPPAHYNHGLMLLLMEDFVTGWDEFAWRLVGRDIAAEFGLTNITAWQGEDLSDKHLLILPEDGFGDALQYSRFILDVAARCRRLSVFERPSLRRLFRHAFPNVEICDELPQADYYVLMLDLPRWLKADRCLIDRGAYLSAPADRTWSERFQHLPSPRVGLVWAGEVLNPIDAQRSLSLNQLAPILAIDVGWVSLQIDHQIDLSIYDASPFIADWLDTATAIKALDLVITVDTAVAHLAGAMGKPVWLMHRFDTDYRWGLQSQRSVWYQSVRIFRQPVLGDWDTVISRVAKNLELWRRTIPVNQLSVDEVESRKGQRFLVWKNPSRQLIDNIAKVNERTSLMAVVTEDDLFVWQDVTVLHDEFVDCTALEGIYLLLRQDNHLLVDFTSICAFELVEINVLDVQWRKIVIENWLKQHPSIMKLYSDGFSIVWYV